MRDDNQDLRVSIILELSQGLKSKGSWCGETHIQKTAYMLRNFGVNDLDYSFILYKHGPYSFDLHGEIALLREANLLSLVVLQDRYGPSFEINQLLGKQFIERHSKSIKSIKKNLDFILNWVGNKDVKSLERLSTALFLRREYPEADVDHRAQILHSIKPHISVVEAENATRQVDLKIEEAEKLGINAYRNSR